MSVASATFAVWVSAWLGGRAASDDVLDALRSWAPKHIVDGDVGTPTTTGLVELMGALRRLGVGAPSLALPVAGDARGLGGGGPLVAAAIDAGEAVLFTHNGISLVPTSTSDGLLWTVYPLGAVNTLDRQSLGEAENALKDAVPSSASALAALDVASDRPAARDALAARLRQAPSVGWPDGIPQRALRVLQKSDELAAILQLAGEDAPGGAVSASAASMRADALRPLADAVRQARCAAVNAATEAFMPTASERPLRTPLHSDDEGADEPFGR